MSMAKYSWQPLSDYSQQELNSFCKRMRVNSIFGKMMLNRGLDSEEKAIKFFSPSWDDVIDPFLFSDMQKAVDRINLAVEQDERVWVYGDYDVDGTTSVALMYSFLRQYIGNIEFYIPDREKEGYGISQQGIEKAIEAGVSLMIVLDCGIRSVELTDLAGKGGIDLIICDHHVPGETLPAAHAILNPKCIDESYPFKELSGCGIGFKLVQALCIAWNHPESEYQSVADFVAVSIASDLVPMTGENRTLAHLGLQKLNSNPSPGLKMIIDKFIQKPELDISNIVFMIGPRINAAGRMANARTAVELLLADGEDQSDELAGLLNSYNQERQGLDKTITNQAWEQLQAQENFPNNRTNVIAGEGWHKGVVGIVASRILEKHYRPTIILTKSDDFYVGSARSIENFDVHEALTACAHLLEQYGGHKYAAGLKIHADKLEAFREAFEHTASELTSKDLTPVLRYESELSIHTITGEFLSNLKRFSPFGPDNPAPVFISRGVWDTGQARTMGSDHSHLKLNLQQSKSHTPITAVGFGLGEVYNDVLGGQLLDIAYSIEENHFRGTTSIQLMLQDIRLHRHSSV